MKSRDEKTESKPVDLSSKLSIITLNVSDLNTQIKDRNWQSGLKIMTQIYALYKTFTSHIMI